MCPGSAHSRSQTESDRAVGYTSAIPRQHSLREPFGIWCQLDPVCLRCLLLGGGRYFPARNTASKTYPLTSLKDGQGEEIEVALERARSR